MAYTVLFPRDIARNGRAFLEQRGYTIKTGSGFDEASLLRDIVDADALLVSHETYSRDILKAGKKLKCIARFGVGFDSIDVEAATDFGIQVTYTPHALTNAVAEHTIALLFACAKRVVFMDGQVRRGNWNIRNNADFMSIELSGKTLGLIGLGRIGLATARIARHGLNMNVRAYDPHLPAERFPDGIAREESLESLAAHSDFVSLHLPATTETEGLIDRAFFSAMRKGSWFINCARGAVVNEADLLKALTDGPLAGAGLDVLVDEPPKPDNPLLALDNVVILPHTGSFTLETRNAMGMTAAESIDDVLSGRPAAWPVNKLP